MEGKNILSMNPKADNYSGKTSKFLAMPKRSEVAVVETMLTLPEKEEKEITDEDIKKALVYGNEVTSIDFMMPESEREILEQNLNVYSNLEEMQKVLNIAKKNKKLSEDIKTLKIISDSTEMIDKIAEVMTDKQSIDVLLQSFREKAAKGDSAKAYKELATTYKLIIDAREEMTRRLNNAGNKKTAKIDLKFTNDNGESFELGVGM